jgi:aminoglycoside phosphotransferase (APT) family kinase protein
MSVFENLVSRESIDRGWSADRKFRATDAGGKSYFLRISPMSRLENRKLQFSHMEQVRDLGIRVCEPVEFGICDEGCYQLLGWVDGRDAEEIIPALSGQAQYAYGLDAGKILAKIHSIPAPADALPWETRFNAKIDRKMAMYKECPLKYDGGEILLCYLSENRHLLAHRPQSYQHGDYHIGNMMITTEGVLTVIDFDKDDYGDPWEEFNRIVWSAQAAPDFARGMVDGYFGGDVPMEFWKLLALYIGSNVLGSLPWAIPFGEKEVSVMRSQAVQVLQWYDNMKNVVPTWYHGE